MIWSIVVSWHCSSYLWTSLLELHGVVIMFLLPLLLGGWAGMGFGQEGSGDYRLGSKNRHV